MTNSVAETDRLLLIEITPNEAEFAYRLNLDPEVIKYTGDEAFDSIEEARAFLEKYDHYEKYGFGRWGVVLKETNKLIGWCGLKYTKELKEHDIGFRFFKNHWNKGYATEATIASLQIGFEKFNMTEIVGRAHGKNIGSIRVLEKSGLKFEKKIDFEGEDGVLFKITFNDWKSLNLKEKL